MNEKTIDNDDPTLAAVSKLFGSMSAPPPLDIETLDGMELAAQTHLLSILQSCEEMEEFIKSDDTHSPLVLLSLIAEVKRHRAKETTP